MTSRIVNASFSLPEGQAVKMIFFAPCCLNFFCENQKLFLMISNSPCQYFSPKIITLNCASFTLLSSPPIFMMVNFVAPPRP